MKRYLLWDRDDEGLVVGTYETLEEMKEAAQEWTEDTSGCCSLEYREYCHERGEYIEIAETAD